MSRAILLLSGGLDSTVAAWLARSELEIVLALTADYGQKAARRELAASYAIARRLEIDHRTIFLPFLREASQGGALVDRHQEVPEMEASALDDPEAAKGGAEAVWVPNRNGVLIAMAATWAEVNDVPYLICGFNAEEARTFPDNSPEFLAAQNAALAHSTRNGVQVVSPTLSLTKTEIVREGRRVGAPLDLVWSCYLGDDTPCGRCESCRRYERAVAQADADSPETTS